MESLLCSARELGATPMCRSKFIMCYEVFLFANKFSTQQQRPSMYDTSSVLCATFRRLRQTLQPASTHRVGPVEGFAIPKARSAWLLKRERTVKNSEGCPPVGRVAVERDGPREPEKLFQKKKKNVNMLLGKIFPRGAKIRADFCWPSVYIVPFHDYHSTKKCTQYWFV